MHQVAFSLPDVYRYTQWTKHTNSDKCISHWITFTLWAFSIVPCQQQKFLSKKRFLPVLSVNKVKNNDLVTWHTGVVANMILIASTGPTLTPRSICRCVPEIAKSDYQFRHVCPSFNMEQLRSHWTEFHEIRYLSIFQKPDHLVHRLFQPLKQHGWRLFCNNSEVKVALRGFLRRQSPFCTAK